MRIRRLTRAVSRFLTQLGAAMLKAVVTSLILAIFALSLMHYMGMPVPSAHDLFGGLSRLAEILG